VKLDLICGGALALCVALVPLFVRWVMWLAEPEADPSAWRGCVGSLDLDHDCARLSRESDTAA